MQRCMQGLACTCEPLARTPSYTSCMRLSPPLGPQRHYTFAAAAAPGPAAAADPSSLLAAAADAAAPAAASAGEIASLLAAGALRRGDCVRVLVAEARAGEEVSELQRQAQAAGGRMPRAFLDLIMCVCRPRAGVH